MRKYSGKNNSGNKAGKLKKILGMCPKKEVKMWC